MIKGLAHVCIGATDLAATERFYCEGLGLRKGFEFIRRGEVIGFYLEVSAGSFIEVFRSDGVDYGAKGPIQHICLEVEDIDRVGRRLKEAGYPATAKSMGADQSWQMWVADPSGVRIEFHQYTAQSAQLTRKTCVLE